MNLLIDWGTIVVLSALICWLPIIFLPRLLERSQKWYVLITLIGLAAIAATAGFTGGLSRVGVVGNVIAAALGLMGGVVAYLFAVDRSKGAIVSVCAVTFSLALFVSYFEAATLRSKPERYAFWREECVKFYSDKNLLNDKFTLLVADKAFGDICARVFNSERRFLLGS